MRSGVVWVIVGLLGGGVARSQTATWQMLFDGKAVHGLHSTRGPGFPASGWAIRDGLLEVTDHGGEEGGNGGDLISTRPYGNFEMEFEFRITPGANSGVKYFVDPAWTPGREGPGANAGFEYQILDDARHPDATKGQGGDRTVASLYDLIAAAPGKPIRSVGEWNRGRIIARGTHGEHWLNGVRVVEYDRASPDFKRRVAESKFHVFPGFGEASRGYILLQNHGFPVQFRNVRLRELPDTGR